MSEETTETDSEVETVETVTEIDPAAAKALASEVASVLKDDIISEVQSILKPVQEQVIQRGITETHDDPMDDRRRVSIAKNVGFDEIKDPESLRENAKFLAKQIQAINSHDGGLVREMNDHVLELRTKAGYNNEGVSAEGGYLVALPLFDATVKRLVPNYGVMVNEIPFSDIEGNTVQVNKGLDTVQFGEVAEAGAKAARKPTYGQDTRSLNKYAAILSATQELLEDQAVDVFEDFTRLFSIAYARKIDEMVLVDNGTTSSKKGILHTTGVNYEPVASPTGITWDDLLNAQYAIPTEANTDNAVYVMHRSVFNTLRQLKGSTSYYLWPEASAGTLGTKNTVRTIDGKRILLSDVMPDTSAANFNGTINGGFVYGDFSLYGKIYRKAPGLVMKTSDTATFTDASGGTVNAWQQNVVAMLGEFRAFFYTWAPNAFCVGAQTNIS